MKIFFRKSGQGKPIIILHGLYGCSDNWIPIAKFFSDYFEVYIPDLRNHGQSPHNEIHNYSAMSEDLFEFMKENNIEKSVILGHSMGGKLAMYFTNCYPEKVEKLVIEDIAPKSYKADIQIIEYHENVLKILLMLNISKIKSFSDAENLLKLEFADENFVKLMIKNLKRNSTGNFEWKLNLNALYSGFDEITDGFSNVKLNKFDKPALFFKGEKSDYIKDNDFDLIKSVYSNSKIVTIKNAGHWLHVDEPQMFINEILDFCKK